MNFQIHFDIPIYQFLLFAGVSAALAYLMYRKLEVVTGGRKLLLGILRGISLFLLFLAMTNLVTDIVRVDFKKKNVILLVDDSKSMSVSDGSVPRPEIVGRILHSASLDSLRQVFNIESVIFGGKVLRGAGIDSLRFDQPSTDLSAAVSQAVRESSNGGTAFAVLISDGDYNRGGSPVDVARDLPFPLFTIGVGDSTAPSDVVVKQVIPAPEMYAGKKSVVKAIVGSKGYGAALVSAQLIDDGRDVSSRNVTLPSSGDVEVSFDYTPTTAGTHILKVYVPPLKGEFSRRNNSASAAADVMKGKYAILLVAGEPATDVAFLRRNIEESGDFDLKVLVQRNADAFYEKDAASVLSGKYDAAVLYDFPNGSSGRTISQVAGKLRESGIPYAYFAGPDFSTDRITGLPRLPFVPEGILDGELQVGVAPVSGETVPVSVQPLYTLLSGNVSLFPPLYYRRIQCKPSEGAVVLAAPVMSGIRLNAPLFIADPSRRSAAFLAYGIWRLQLMSPLSGLRSDFLQEFMTTLLRTLISGGKQKLLSVTTDKSVYDPSEPVNFNAFLVGQGGRPLDSARVVLTLKNRSGVTVSDIRLGPVGMGGYTGSISGLGEGKYEFVAHAASGRTFIGSDSGSVIVEPLNVEFTQTAMNASLMRQLASVSGGRFYTPSQFAREGITLEPSWKEPLRLSRSGRFELLSSLPVLLLVFILLVVEWTLRKIWGLP